MTKDALAVYCDVKQRLIRDCLNKVDTYKVDIRGAMREYIGSLPLKQGSIHTFRFDNKPCRLYVGVIVLRYNGAFGALELDPSTVIRNVHFNGMEEKILKRLPNLGGVTLEMLENIKKDTNDGH
jgi:hypothetical protein